MDTHMDLYIEHYNDLHTYINDNICKINYNSELLTEETKKGWYENIRDKVSSGIMNFINKIKEIIFKWFKIASLSKLEELNNENEELNNKIKKLKEQLQNSNQIANNKIDEINKKNLEKNMVELTKMKEELVSDYINNFSAEVTKSLSDFTVPGFINLLSRLEKDDNEKKTKNLIAIMCDKQGDKANYLLLQETEELWSKLFFIPDAILNEIELNKEQPELLKQLNGIFTKEQKGIWTTNFESSLKIPDNIESNYSSNSNLFINLYQDANQAFTIFKSKLKNYSRQQDLINFINNNHKSNNTTKIKQNSSGLSEDDLKMIFNESVNYIEEAKSTKKIKPKPTNSKSTDSNSSIPAKKQKKSKNNFSVDNFRTLITSINLTEKYINALKISKRILFTINKSKLFIATKKILESIARRILSKEAEQSNQKELNI